MPTIDQFLAYSNTNKVGGKTGCGLLQGYLGEALHSTYDQILGLAAVTPRLRLCFADPPMIVLSASPRQTDDFDSH